MLRAACKPKAWGKDAHITHPVCWTGGQSQRPEGGNRCYDPMTWAPARDHAVPLLSQGKINVQVFYLLESREESEIVLGDSLQEH